MNNPRKFIAGLTLTCMFVMGYAMGTIILISGCAHKKPANPKADFQRGYQEGFKKAQKAYVSEYGDLLTACASRDTVASINKTLTTCKNMLKKGVKFSRRCLKGAKKYKARAEHCAAQKEIFKKSLDTCVDKLLKTDGSADLTGILEEK